HAEKHNAGPRSLIAKSLVNRVNVPRFILPCAQIGGVVDMAKIAFPTTNLSRRLLVRGESVIASTGLTLAAILLGAMAAASGWALKTQRDSLQAARDQQIHATGEMLALASERLLAADDITGLRSLITEAARMYGL